MERWPEPVARVAEVLQRAGVDARVEEFPEGTPTASAAAKAVGASRAQIVARPEEVVAATGFEPGGVAPFPLPAISQVLITEELLAHDRVWIGAGSEHHMAGLAPLDLVRLTQAHTADLT